MTVKNPHTPVLLRKLAWFAACVLLFEIGLIAIAPQLHPDSVLKRTERTLELRAGNDSIYYMEQGDLAAHQAPNALYETVFFQRGVRFIYPPTALLLYRAWQQSSRFGISPFFAMNITVFLSFWATLILAGQFLLVLVRSQSESPWNTRDQWLLRVLIAIMGLIFLPLVNAYSLGQVQTLLTLALVASIFLWMRGQRVAPGILIGLTCLIKPQMALFLLWAALRRQWSFAVSLAAMLMTGGLLSIAVFGWHNSVEYLAVLRYLSRHGDSLATNQSLNGLLHRLLHVGYFNTSAYGYPPYSPAIYWLTICGSAIILLAALIVPYRQHITGSTLDLLLFAMATTMASPIAWEHHYGVFFIVFLAWMPQAAKHRGVFFLLLAAYLLMTDTWAPLSYLMFTRWTFLLSHVFYGGLLLYIWTLWRGRRQLFLPSNLQDSESV
ncbi:MAG TPA: glycosyltransferase family 87 protein [Acidobacteriaceae bacterium]|nr:glycosyltransferase family 87 protein [Acidobacteriaceae bacterium]